MGCSPSKGKLFSKGLEGQNTVVAQDGAGSRPVEEIKCVRSNEVEKELPQTQEEHTARDAELCQTVPDTADTRSTEDIQDDEMKVPQDSTNEVKTHKIKNIEKRKKSKDKRKCSEKKRKSSVTQRWTKVDFPPHMVRAHQAAYAYLNPNISKFETLMGLLEQAAQTQLSLRPMMSALVLRFEELNQALEEMAEEGELLLKEHGHCMALSSGMTGTSVLPTIPLSASAKNLDPPPDMLQLLLQQSVEKMRLVGSSVQALGDTTLEEAAAYFASLARMLVEKLQAKKAAERRMAQVLAQVEAAAVKKSNPEDSALHSEDSGIGGENESLTGSEKHRRHRGSTESASCGSGNNIHAALEAVWSNSPKPVDHNIDDEEDEDDEDDEEYEDDDSEISGRKRSNSSPPDPSQPLPSTQVQQDALRRPLTASKANKPEHSLSSGAASTVMELQTSQKDLDQRMKRMAERQRNTAGSRCHFYTAGIRQHSLSGSGGGCAQKRPLKTNQLPCSLPILPQRTYNCQSVRRLINTFSQGADGCSGQSLAGVSPNIRKPQKNRVVILTDRGSCHDRDLVINGNNNSNAWPEGRDDLDVDNLPPPPPEVLMDDSFQSTEDTAGNKEASVQSHLVINQKTPVTQCMRMSVQNLEVLPNRASVRPRGISVSSSRPIRQDAVLGWQDADQHTETVFDPETEKANCLYQQARKIIHLRNATESPVRGNTVAQSARAHSPLQAKTYQGVESNEHFEADMSPCSLPVTAPPVFRVRLPPSCPSVQHQFTSPPVFRPQPPSNNSSRPGSPRAVTRAVQNKTEEIIPSVSFRAARSVFCQNEWQNSQSQNRCPSGFSVLPLPWGETSRGRLPSRGMNSSTRRTQSEQRPTSLTSHFETVNSDSTQPKGRVHITTRQRLNSSEMTEGHAHMDPSATVMTS
ncbi:uncharacterized protein LOC117502616 [Thalassophryne amazonica]|uniref:uncharacterized protein LOC117502616 n=1 Tax=Thalassophryne amazonica TaxID=390379 RepID=UPI001471A9B0|nr:uncharacterized protein LOC117502616 [Thalassophryne amazonica]